MGGAGQSAGTARLAESLALQLLALTQAVLHLREELLHLRLDVVKHLGGQAVDGLQNCLEARLGQHEALEVAALLRPDGRDVVGEGVRRLVHARSHLQDKLLDGLCRGEHVSRLGGDSWGGHVSRGTAARACLSAHSGIQPERPRCIFSRTFCLQSGVRPRWNFARTVARPCR